MTTLAMGVTSSLFIHLLLYSSSLNVNVVTPATERMHMEIVIRNCVVCVVGPFACLACEPPPSVNY